jgi:hypothetical protein
VVIKADYEFEQTLLSGAYTLRWKVDGDNIQINMETQGNVWLGFGIGLSMDDHADVYQGYITTEGTAIISDRHTVGTVPPETDAQSNILASKGSFEGGISSYHFIRPLKSPDTVDDRDITDGDLNCIIAIGQDQQPGVQHAERTKVVINFFSGTAATDSTATTLRTWHGIVMFVSWAVLIVIGSIIARFFKNIGKAWFWAHVGLNSIGVLAFIAAFVLIIIATDIEQVTHFVRDPSASGSTSYMAHAWIGIIAMVFGVVQPGIGWWADRKYDPNRPSIPIWPDMVHWWIGRAAVLLALLNIYIGIYVLNDITGVALWVRIVYGVWLGAIFIVLASLQIYRLVKGHEH